MQGIKETKEMLVGVNEVSIFLISLFKDGLDLEDFSDIWNKLTCDEDFKKKIENAYEGCTKIPAEIKDLSVEEGMELLKIQADLVTKIADLFKNTGKRQ